MRRGGRGQPIPRDQEEFPWYNFSQVVSQRTMTEWRNKLEKLKTKEVYIANEMNWTWLKEVGLVESMNPYLTKVFVNDGVRVHVLCGEDCFRFKSQFIKSRAWSFMEWFNIGVVIIILIHTL